MQPRRLQLAAGLLGLTGVALGAFGAHALKAALESAGQVENWKTAVFYQLVHAVALFALAQQPGAAGGKAGWAWIAGVICFSGSLYWLALGGPIKFLWPVTPLGGLLLLVGWALVIISALRQPEGR